MVKAKDELSQQTHALEKLTDFYLRGQGTELLTSLPHDTTPFFSGMGASAEAAMIAAMHCQGFAVPALAVEGNEIISMPAALLTRFSPLVYVSPTGEDAEIPLVLRKVEQGPLIALTDNEQSTLALSANKVLPLGAGDEPPNTQKAYLNSLALLWLMCRKMCAKWDGGEEEQLQKVAKRVQVLQSGKATLLDSWHAAMDGVHHLIFTGQGPQAISARRGAALMAAIARVPVQAVSLGSMHSGFVELSQPGVGAVIFASAANGLAEEMVLANELDEYGVNVLLVIDGMPRRIREEPPLPSGFDPFLTTILDAIPPQLWAIDLLQAQSGNKPKGGWNPK